MINISMPETDSLLKPRIVVFGVGGAGTNAINNMIRSGLEGVEFIAANTDAQALASNLAPKKLQLGSTVTKGLGAGARPDVGRAAAEEQLDEINAHLDGAHMCFITAGMGGGTGTGAGPVIARVARERGILTVGVITKPFQFEGPVRMRSAEAGIQDLQQYVDTLIIIPNQNLFRIANEKTTWSDAFKLADDVLYQGVRGVTDLIMTPGQINLDFADIRSVMSEMGKAMMGTGEAEGDNRALQAAEMAINNPLLDDASVKGARGVLINITGGPDLTLFEVEEAANRIRDEVDPDANIIFGTALDEGMTGKIRISVVATGIDLESARQRPPLQVVDSTGKAQGGQAAYAPAGAPQGGNRAPAAGPLFTSAAPLQQAASPQGNGNRSVAMAGNAAPLSQTPFYSGLQQAEQVGNTLRVPQMQPEQFVQQPSAHQPSQPLRGQRQGDQFYAPAPAQAQRQPQQQEMQQQVFQAPTAPAAQAQPRRASFGQRLMGKVKDLVRQIDGEEAMDRPAQQPQQPQPQQQAQPQQRAASGYEVTQGGKAGLPPVADVELDIPSFLRRQAN